jgi:hypothetical protein
MLKINDYFEGRVKSIAFQAAGGAATVGVIASGEFEFGTSTREIMTVISGVLSVSLPDAGAWRDYRAGETFTVEKDKKFRVRAAADAAYLCLYQ